MRALALAVLMLLGLATAGVSGYFLLRDWRALGVAFTRFEALSRSGADLRTLFVAAEMDRVYRTNCFADGVGVLFGAVLAAIGVHGLCLLPRRRPGAD